MLYGNDTGAVGATAAGTTGQCLIATTDAAPSWGSCAGTGSGATLQAAYDNGNAITTSNARDIDLVLADTATDSNLDIDIVADNTVSISRTDNASSEAPAQLLLVENLDTNLAVTAGLLIQSAAGTITTAIDASDAEIGTALAIGSNDITTGATTISSAELDRLDGKDAALVDVNDAVTTAITGTGALASGSIAAGFGTIATANTITGTTINGTTGINTGAGAGTQRIDASGNLVAIGNLTAAGAITIASAGGGNDVTIDGADQFIVQDASVFNGTATFNSDIDVVLAGTENISVTSDLAGSVDVLSLVTTPSGSAGTTRGIFIQQADSANSNGLDTALLIDNADTNLALTTGLLVQGRGGR